MDVSLKLKCALLFAGIGVLVPFYAMAGDMANDSSALFEYRVSAIGVASSGDFAPYMIGSWNYDRTTAKNQASLDIEVSHKLDLSKRFSWAAGAEVLTGYAHKADYQHYSDGTWSTRSIGPAAIRIQQLYGQVKYRGVFLTAGMKNQHSILVDNDLSSGDPVQSNNFRPVPMVTVGFIDYQDIPFTRGWVQIEGRIGYGKFADNDYLDDQYNCWNNHLATGVLYTYKRAYFRTKPSAPLCVTAGAQVAGQFGGTTKYYYRGTHTGTVDNPQSLKTFWQMFIPTLDNGDGFYEGSQLGSWDFKARYRLRSGHELSAYFSWLWEDGSSMAKRNKLDGLWGVQWRAPHHGFITSALIEYIDFRDQSGPIHFAPGDHPGTTITTEATGSDDYYNNASFNGHANYGMAMGTPFMLSPVYNLDGYPQFAFNRTRGFHAAAQGGVSNSIDWRAKVSYQVARGNGRNDWPTTLHNTSAMISALWHADTLLKGLSINATAAFDAGNLRGDNFGFLLGINYSGKIL